MLFVVFYWEITESSVLFGLVIAYFAVIINNLVVIRRNKNKLDIERSIKLKLPNGYLYQVPIGKIDFKNASNYTNQGIVVDVVEAGVVEVRDPTVKISGGLVIPNNVAVILVIPAPTPVPKPPEDIVATDIFELFHVTWGVIAAYAVSE